MDDEDGWADWGNCSECGEFDCDLDHDEQDDEIDSAWEWGYDGECC